MCNFRALESEYEVDDLLQSLKDVPMIPLANGSVVSLSSEGVFFPLSDVMQAQTGNSSASQSSSPDMQWYFSYSFLDIGYLYTGASKKNYIVKKLNF